MNDEADWNIEPQIEKSANASFVTENSSGADERVAPLAPVSPATSAGPTTFKMREPNDRSKRIEKHPLLKILPPVLGGLASLPLATAILWYGFGRDIGGIGPTVARYVPWIVPKALHGSSFRADGTMGTQANDWKMQNSQNNSLRLLPNDGIKSNLPSIESSRSSTNDSAASSALLESSPDTKRSAATNPAPAELIDSTLKNLSDDQNAAHKESSSLDPNTTTPILDSSQQLVEVIHFLEDLSKNWSSIPRERSAQLKAVGDFYKGICDIAKLIDDDQIVTSDDRSLYRAAIAKLVLDEPKFTALIKRCASGEIENMISIERGAHAASIIDSLTQIKMQDTASESEELFIESIIAGNHVRIMVPRQNEELYARINSLMNQAKETRGLIFFRIEPVADSLVFTATECLFSNAEH